MYWLWGAVGAGALVAGWLGLARVANPVRRRWSRAALGAVVGAVAYVGPGHGVAFPVPAVLMLLSDAFLGALVWLAIWMFVLGGLFKLVSRFSSEEGSVGFVIAFAMPFALIGALEALDSARDRAVRAPHQISSAQSREHAKAAEDAAYARRAKRAQSFEWTQAPEGLVLVVSPSAEPMHTLTAPPAPVDGEVLIRGLPGAGIPENGPYSRTSISAKTDQLASRAWMNDDGSYEIRLPVAAGERIQLRQITELSAGPPARILLEEPP